MGKPVRKPKKAVDQLQAAEEKPAKDTFEDLEAEIQPLIVKQPDQPATQDCSVIMNKLQDGDQGLQDEPKVSKEEKKDQVRRRKRKANKTGFPSVKKRKKGET